MFLRLKLYSVEETLVEFQEINSRQATQCELEQSAVLN